MTARYEDPLYAEQDGGSGARRLSGSAHSAPLRAWNHGAFLNSLLNGAGNFLIFAAEFWPASKNILAYLKTVK